MSQSKVMVYIGIALAFIGMWLPYIGNYTDMFSFYSGGEALDWFLRGGGSSSSPNISDLLPFILLTVCYAIIALLVFTAPDDNPTLSTAALVMVFAVFLQLVLLMISISDAMTKLAIEGGASELWQDFRFNFGVVFLALGLPLLIVGVLQCWLEQYQARYWRLEDRLKNLERDATQ